MRPFLLLLFSPLFLHSCQLSRRAAADKEPEKAMQAVYDTFTKAYRQADPDMVANLYTRDAYYLAPNTTIMQGRDSIRAYFANYLERFTPGAGPDISFEIIERRISGDQGYDIGYYLNEGRRGGKFIVLWERQPDGRWLIRGDGYSGLGE